jgi:hypothetical protein
MPRKRPARQTYHRAEGMRLIGPRSRSGDATAHVRKRKEEFDCEQQVPGSHQLVQELIESDLVDQINMMVFPVILGTGKTDRRPAHLVRSSRGRATGLVPRPQRSRGRPRCGYSRTAPLVPGPWPPWPPRPVSRATLARRFTELVGEPPMRYLTGWRLALAADLLREPDVRPASGKKLRARDHHPNRPQYMTSEARPSRQRSP